VALRAALYYAINEQLAPAVRAAAAGIDVKAVLTAALPPVPSIADLLAVRAWMDLDSIHQNILPS
jgi:hypothetical protein